MNTVTTSDTTTGKVRRWLWPIATATALFVGIAIGGAGQGSIPEPEIVTETVTETETVSVETTPQVCIDAIDLAYDGFGIAAEIMDAASNFDIAGMDAGTEKLNGLAPLWQETATRCQAS